MDTYEVELEATDTSGFALTINALPGLLILGSTVDEECGAPEPRSPTTTETRVTRSVGSRSPSCLAAYSGAIITRTGEQPTIAE